MVFVHETACHEVPFVFVLHKKVRKSGHALFTWHRRDTASLLSSLGFNLNS